MGVFAADGGELEFVGDQTGIFGDKVGDFYHDASDVGSVDGVGSVRCEVGGVAGSVISACDCVRASGVCIEDV